MKKVASLLLVIFCIVNSILAQKNYWVNTEISSVEWIGKKVTGQHEGLIQMKNSKYTFQNGTINSGTFLIDMQTIAVTDIDDQEQNEKLKNHFISKDFFSVKEHPTAKLQIVKSDQIGENKLNVSGDLTIKGITKRIEFETTLLIEDKKMVAIGQAHIDRTQYDIRYGSGSFIDNLGDKAIKDLFTIKFKVAALAE